MRWDLTSGQCTLHRIGMDGKDEQLAVQATSVKAPGSYLLRFANFDARLTVWVDRDLPFGDGQAYDPPEVRGPNDKNLSSEEIAKRRGPRENDVKQPASIGSKEARVKLSHVRLWRDTYYTTSAGGPPDYSIKDSPPEHEPEKLRDFMRDFWSDPAMGSHSRTVLRDHVCAARPLSVFGRQQPGEFRQPRMGDRAGASDAGPVLVVYFPFDRIGPIY